MKKIDAHFHLNLNGYNLDAILKYLDNKQIEKCWLLSWEELAPPIPHLYKHLSADNLLDAYEKYPDRIVPFYAPDPKTLNLKSKLKAYIARGIKGCGELKVTHNWDEPIIENYLQIINELQIPLIFHMEAPRQHYVPKKRNQSGKFADMLFNGAFNGVSKYYINQVAEKTGLLTQHIKKHSRYFPGYMYDFVHLEKRLQQFPDLKFIGHGPHFWNNIADEMSAKYFHQKGDINNFGIIDKLLATYDNFFCDISGTSGYNALSRNKAKSKNFLDKHYQKILFGTDNTKFNLEGLVYSLNLPEEKLQRIFYTNAHEI